jgi:cell division septal protein FtsQ
MDAARIAPAEARASDPAQSLQFQRNRHRVKSRTRRIRLRLGHILVLLAMVGALFVGVQRVSLMAFSSGAFALKTIDLGGASEHSRARITSLLEARRGLSLFLLDTASLRDEIQGLSWIKEARLTKVLPARLTVRVKERTAMAVLDAPTPVLVDEEGVRLAPVDPAALPDLPLIRAEGGFEDDYEGKIGLARACLRALPEDKRKGLAAVDVGVPGRVGILLRDCPVKVYCLPERAAAGLDYFERRLDEWQSRFGPLDYVDLTVPDRAYLGPVRTDSLSEAGRPGAGKEVE